MSNQFHAFHLPKVGGVAQHVYEEQLCDVSVTVDRVLFLEQVPHERTFFGNDSSFFGRSLALSYVSNKLSVRVRIGGFKSSSNNKHKSRAINNERFSRIEIP